MDNLQDFANMKSLLGDRGTDMTSYEHFMMSEKTAKRPSGTAIAGLVLGSVGTAAAIGAWIFAPLYASSKAKGNTELIRANQAHSQQMETLLANNILNERTERVNYIQNQNPSLKDYITVQQTGSQATNANASALATAEASVLAGLMTGQYQQCPQKVSLYSAPQPCGCPGCNG